jgi:hypothetical protein
MFVFHVCYSVFVLSCVFKCASIMHLLYGDFFALYKFNNQSINQSILTDKIVLVVQSTPPSTGSLVSV